MYIKSLKIFKILICSKLIHLGCEGLLLFYYVRRCYNIRSLFF
jgi:hypothetical protein